MVSLHIWNYCSGSDQSISVQSSIFGLGVCQGNDGNGYMVLQFYCSMSEICCGCSKSSFFPGRWNNTCFVLDVLDKKPWENHDLYSFYNAILVLLIRCNIFFLWEKFISNNMLKSSEKIRNLKYSSPMDGCNNQPSSTNQSLLTNDVTGKMKFFIVGFTAVLHQPLVSKL